MFRGRSYLGKTLVSISQLWQCPDNWPLSTVVAPSHAGPVPERQQFCLVQIQWRFFHIDVTWQWKHVLKTRGFSRSSVPQDKSCFCHCEAAHELCPERRGISPDALLLPQMISFSRNEHFLMKRISLRNFYRGSISPPTFFKNLRIFFVLFCFLFLWFCFFPEN